MSQEHYIDNLFREKLLKRDLPFDASGWTDVEQLLDDQKKKRFFLYRFRYYLSAIILALMVSVGYFIGNDNTTSVSTKNSVSTQNSTKINSNNKSPLLANSNTTVIPENTEYQSNSTPQVIEQPKEVSTVSKPESFNIDETDENVSQLNTFSAPKNNAVTPNTVENISSEHANVLATEIPEVIEVSDQVNDASSVNENATPSTLAAVPIKVNSNILATAQKTRSTSENQYLTSSISDNSEFAYMPIINTIDQSVDDLELMLPTPPVIERSSPSERMESAIKGWKIIAGAGITNGEKNIENGSKTGLSYFVGVAWEKTILKGFSIDAGLSLSGRNAFGLVYESEELYYNFGYQQTLHTYTFKQLYFIELPVIINYQPWPRHQIGLGAQYNYLISSKYEVSKTTSSSLTSPSGETKNEYGTNEGLTGSDLSILLNYSYRINDKFDALLRFQYGFSDISQPAYFGSEKDSNHQLRLGLSYNLYK